jgi:hypothetical protein
MTKLCAQSCQSCAKDDTFRQCRLRIRAERARRILLEKLLAFGMATADDVRRAVELPAGSVSGVACGLGKRPDASHEADAAADTHA